MDVAVFSTENEIATVAADRIVAVVKRKPNAVIGLATGSSPIPIYQELIRRYQAGEVSFAQAQAFQLDEYVGLEPGHPQSYLTFIRREFTDQVDFQRENVHVPAAVTGDLLVDCEQYDAQIKAAGGVDIQILGIGSDGHIGFNEPGGSLTSRTHPCFLHEQTIKDNARFFDGDMSRVPTMALTQGLGTIMEARELLLVAAGAPKAAAVAEMVEKAVRALWPATIMQFHNQATVLLDDAAASQLTLASYYHSVWEKNQELGRNE